VKPYPDRKKGLITYIHYNEYPLLSLHIISNHLSWSRQAKPHPLFRGSKIMSLSMSSL